MSRIGRLRGSMLSLPVGAATLLVTVIAGVGLVAPPPLVFFGALTVGPILAAMAASAVGVAAVGAYTVLVALLVSWTDRAGYEQVSFLGVIVAVTALSALVAHRQRRARELAQAGRLMLAAVAEASDDAVVIKDLDGIIRAWNPGAERMYGYPGSEAVGRHISLIMPSVEAEQLPELLGRVAQGEHVEHYEVRRVAKDGRVLDVSVNLTPIRDHDGVVTAVAATGRDITGRRQAEALARQVQQRAALNERLESLGQLAGGIAHDFNNILAIILNYTEFLTETIGDAPAAQADLARIRGAAERAQALVRQLMVFARREPTRAEDLDLPAVVDSTANLLRTAVGEQINVITKIYAPHLHVHADRGQLEQMLLNLALNARDAMPEGGTLVIETHPVEVDGDRDDLQPPLPPGRYARLLISDTGTGMTRDVAARACEPFFTTKPKDKAAGLGLATVYGIVHQAGGTIKIYSEPGIGTTVRIYLPAVDEPAPAVGPTEQPPDGQGEHVLVVEDEAAVRDLVVRILDQHGYHALAADCGSLALDLTHEHPIDIVLTDVIMPEMSGPDLARQIRDHHPDLPIVFMSGYSDGLLTAQHLVQPDTPLIQKPFTATELLTAIHHTLGPAPRLARAPHHQPDRSTTYAEEARTP